VSALTKSRAACLWCGRKLRRRCRTEWAYTDAYNPPRACIGCSRMYEEVNGDWEPDPSGEPHLFRCKTCDHGEQHGSRKRKVVSRVPVHDKPGAYGDGHFCGKGCGYQFGVALADAGYRLKRNR